MYMYSLSILVAIVTVIMLIHASIRYTRIIDMKFDKEEVDVTMSIDLHSLHAARCCVLTLLVLKSKTDR